MIGNAFENTVRLQSKREFERVYQAQQQLFAPIGMPMTVPMQIKGKDTFGGINIIIPTGFAPKILKILNQHHLAYSGNGVVTGYLTKERHQISLIAVRPNLISYATHYFAHGGSGDILGQIIKKPFHLKNSFNGLYYVYSKDADSHQKELLLSLEYKDLIKMLELDWSHFERGFDTNKQLFDWLYTSPFLDTDVFKFENPNYTKRVHDQKQKFYQEWLEYLADKPKKPTKKPKSLSAYFESFDRQYAYADTEYQKLKAYKDKFNSKLVTLLTGLSGEPLGDFLAMFADEYTKDQILEMDDIELKFSILSLYRDIN